MTVPTLPGCVTWGEDYAHALAMAQEAITGYLEVLEQEGDPIPEDDIEEPIDALVEVSPSALA